jgi:hypothetical protein
MRILFLAAVLLAACKSKAPEAAVPPAAEGQPAPAPMMDKNEAEKYVKSLQNDVKKAEAARDKANAAIKTGEEERKAGE